MRSQRITRSLLNLQSQTHSLQNARASITLPIRPLSTSSLHTLHPNSSPQTTTITKPRNPTHLQPHGTRTLHTTSHKKIDILDPSSTPDNDPNKTPHSGDTTAKHVELSEQEFHEKSDEYLGTLLEKLEEMQEERGDLDVEYASGVLNIIAPGAGTYVINKQPPNKQIWLSSPISGPKRFDWAVVGDGMNHKEGSGNAGGEWVYLRDGTTMSSILRGELGVDFGG